MVRAFQSCVPGRLPQCTGTYIGQWFMLDADATPCRTSNGPVQKIGGPPLQDSPPIFAQYHFCAAMRHGPYLTTLRRCTVRSPFTVMFTMYTPVARSLGMSSTVVKRSPLLPYSLLNTCLP